MIFLPITYSMNFRFMLTSAAVCAAVCLYRLGINIAIWSYVKKKYK